MPEHSNLRISDTRAYAVYNDIVSGSEPGVRFYTMVAVSTAIAAFGLIQDSAAVVIGAMLVAPLMTPIFGIALGLIRGNARLLGRALLAEAVGVVATISIAILIGVILPGIEVTDQMLSRTHPNLLDLLVAVFAGLAGAYALVDEKISPALPGVAISTAIVPPLANVGLCISLQAYQGALGSFLLFLANFLSILLISSAIFFYSGMSRNFPFITSKILLKRFGVAFFGFLLITAILSKALYDMTLERQLTNKISQVLLSELANLPATDIRQVLHNKKGDKMYVMAHLYSPNSISPSRVSTIQKALAVKLSMPIELFIRSTLSNDISSSGLLNQIETQGLDGFYLNRKSNPRVLISRMAEQIIREFLQSRLGLYLEETNLIEIIGIDHVLATVFGPRQLSNDEISLLEQEIRSQTKNDTINLVIRHVNVDLYDRLGLAYLEFAEVDITSSDETAGKIQDFLEINFNNSKYLFDNLDITFRENKYHILVELKGTQFFTEDEHTRLQRDLSDLTDHPVVLYVRSTPEVVITKDGNISFKKLKKEMLQQMERLHAGQLKRISEDTL